jgi:integrase
LGIKRPPPKFSGCPPSRTSRRATFAADSYRKLVDGAELWFRTLVECGRTYGWRVSELLNLRVAQVDLAQSAIRLEPGTTKNSDGREVFMTDAVHAMLTACIAGKAAEEHVFTRANGNPVLSFRGTWERECTRAGVGRLVCGHCGATATDTARCSQCGFKGTRYAGLIFHDLRRTATRNLRRAGIGETVIMKIGGWRTRSVFDRYAIVNRTDIADAMRKLHNTEAEIQISTQIGHDADAMENGAQSLRVN